MLTDTFTEASDLTFASHVSDSGHTAARVAGSTTQTVGSNGNLRGSGTAALAIYRYDWVPPSANYYVLTRNLAPTQLAGMKSGVRVSATGDGYFGYWVASGGTYGLMTRVGGVETPTTVATSGTTPRFLRLEIEDTTLRLLASTDVETLVEVLSITVDPVADGLSDAGGVGTHNSSAAFTATSRVQLDSLEADALGAPPAAGTNDELLSIRRRPRRGLVLRHL